MSKRIISTKNAPAAIGPYSQAVLIDEKWLFASGQIPIQPETGEIVGSSIEDQTKQVMKNLQAVLEAAKMTFTNVVKTTIYLTDLADFSTVNKIYGEFFKEHPPARATVQAAGLPKGVKVEIDLVAVL